jgi:hypothetical protein
MLSDFQPVLVVKDPRGVLYVLRFMHVLTSVKKTLARALLSPFSRDN